MEFPYLRTLTLLSLIAAPCFAITSATSGDCNVGATWIGGVAPTSADPVVIADGTTVTGPVGVTCSGSTWQIAQGGASPSTAKLIINGTWDASHGNVTIVNTAGINTAGYCAITVNAGATVNLGSSSITAAAGMPDSTICWSGSPNAGDSSAMTTGSNHITLTASGGYINLSSFNNTIHYLDATGMGDGTHPALQFAGIGGGSLLTIDHFVCTGCDSHAQLVVTGLAATDNYNIHDNFFFESTNRDHFSYCFAQSPSATNGSTSRIWKGNWCDTAIGNPAGLSDWSGAAITNSEFNRPAGNSNQGQTVSFSDNLVIYTYDQSDPGSPGSEFTSPGSVSGMYFYYPADIGHKHWFVPASPGQTFDKMIFDQAATAPCAGSDIMLTGNVSGATGVNFPLSHAFVQPPAVKNCSPGGILQPLNTWPTPYTLSLDHSGVYAATEGLNLYDTPHKGPVSAVVHVISGSPNVSYVSGTNFYSTPPTTKICIGDTTIDCPGGTLYDVISGTSTSLVLSTNYVGSTADVNGVVDCIPCYHTEVAFVKNSIFFVPPAYDQGMGAKVKDVSHGCVSDLIAPGQAHNNAAWGIVGTIPSVSCFTNQGKGYWLASSAPLGPNDPVNQDPQPVDLYRTIDKWDTDFLGTPAASPWATSTSYTKGQIVSNSVPTYRNGATLNWRCIQSHTSSSSNEPGSPSPGNGLNWRAQWEPASLQDLRNAMYAGVTYTSLAPTAALFDWTAKGWEPQNRNLCNAADDGTTTGPMPCSPALPLQISGPDSCQQGQSCTYSTTGGSPPYSYSLVSGSVGSVNSSTGVYSAPSTVTPQQSFNGCMGLPSNNIFNTRVDNLPLDPSSTLWVANMTLYTGNVGNGSFGTSQRLNGSVALSTDRPVGMQYNYSPNPAITVDTYSINNGVGHSDRMMDAIYLPVQSTWATWGNPAISYNTLTLGTGYLTDGVIGPANPFSDGSATLAALTGSWNSGTNQSTLTVCASCIPGSWADGDWITIRGVASSINPTGYNSVHAQIVSHTTSSVNFFYANSDPGSVTNPGFGTIQHDIPEGVQAINWIGWALDSQSSTCDPAIYPSGVCPFDTNDTFATFTFHLTVPSLVQDVKLYITNLPDAGIGAPQSITVDFSNDNTTFVNPVVYSTTSGEKLEGAHTLTVPITELGAWKDIRFRMKHQNYTPGSGTCSGACAASNFILVTEAKVEGIGNGLIFQAFPNTVSQAGAAWTTPGDFTEPDDHFLTTYRDTCQQAETYKYYSFGVFTGGFGQPTNSASGTLYPLLSNKLTGVGTDAAQLPLSPLIYHQDEILDAAKGNVDAIKHATRVTFAVPSINTGAHIWPAQADNGSFSDCATRNIVGDGTTAVTAYPGQFFMTGWPLPLSILIDGSPATLTAIADSTHATVSVTVSVGVHGMTQPHGSCIPYGGRMRLKASYNWVPPFACDTQCINIGNAVVRQQKRYGLIVADIGTSFEGDGDFGSVLGFSLQQAALNLAIPSTPDNYEIVDESTLQTSQTYGTPDATWAEAKLGNAYVTPANAAVIKVTDALSATTYFSVGLQAVVVGVEHPSELVMAGASPFQLHPWVTGSSNTGFTCSLSPSGAGGGTNYGTITSGCLYSPPSSSSVSSSQITQTTVTVTSAADPTVSKTISIQIVPLSSDGNLHISTGKAYPSSLGTTYTDTAGVVWWNDMVEGLTPALSTDDFGNSQSGTWADYPGSSYVATSPGLFAYFLYDSVNDHHFRIHVPNGSVTGIVLNTNRTSGTGQAGFSFDCNGTIEIPNTDTFSWTAGQYVNRPMSCTRTISDGLLHMVVRPQGAALGTTQQGITCLSPCYDTAAAAAYNFVPGIIVIPGGTPPSPTPTTFNGGTLRGIGIR